MPRRGTTRLAGFVMVGALGLTAAACGSSHSSGASGSATTSSSTAAAASAPLATLTNLTGVHTQVVLAPSFVAALTSLKVTPGVLGSATLANGTVSFPITGGNVTYYKPGSRQPYVTGQIMHNGSGLSLSAGGKKVDLTNFDVNPGTSMLTGDVSVNGKSFAKGIELFFLDGSSLQPLTKDTAANTATLYGTQVKIAPGAAAALSKVFGATVPSYLLVGTARIVVKL